MARLSGKRVVIIHGWSDNWESMRKVGNPLRAEGAHVYYADYDSREDQAVYEDFAERLERELKRYELLGGADRDLHFITHSTGALVLRQWFRQYPKSQDKVGNVIFLAPANFGSPLASMGKSLIGKIFKGHHGLDDDAFEVGEQVLNGLELASPLSWALADHDLFGPAGSLYHKGGIRASVITGHGTYGGLRHFVNKPGTDGTIVVSGANLNVRKLGLNFVQTEGKSWSRWQGFAIDETPEPGVIPPNLPFAIHQKLNHATILELEKRGKLRQQVIRCLNTPPNKYEAIREAFAKFTAGEVRRDESLKYQQFLFRVIDDRNMPVPDYHLEFNVWRASRLRESYSRGPRHVPRTERMSRDEERLSGQLDEMLEAGLHTHSQDSSYKRYLLIPARVKDILNKAKRKTGKDHVITVRINAKSGDPDIRYRTNALDNVLLYHSSPDFPVKIQPFYPNTTTLIQIQIDRQSNLLKLGKTKADF